MSYQLFVGPSSGTAPTQEVTIFDAWSLDRNLDDGCTMSFTIPGNSPAGLLDELSWDVWLYLDGNIDQRFRVLEVERQWDEDGRYDIAVSAVCYRRILASRHLVTDLSYSSTSQGTILWNLIQHTQAQTGGDLGITLGDAGPTVLRDRNYDAGSNILELAVNLSQIQGGLTFDINENLELIVSRASDYPVRAQPVVLGSNARNITKPSGASLFANAVLVTGDQEATTLVVEEDAGLSTDPRGRWERYQSFPSVVLQTTLQEHADGLLEEANSPAIVWAFEIDPARFFGDSDYALGDFLTLIEPGTQTVHYVQVLTQSVSQSADGQVTVLYNAVEVPELPTVEVEYLVVAGGGGGGLGGDFGGIIGAGGGGAGGLLSNFGSTTYEVSTNTPYAITVGDGGARNGGDGEDSLFASFVATGGGFGGGGGASGSAGGNGGSGGGSALGAAGTGIAGQGNDGGAGAGIGGGGGGGAGAVGGNASTPAGNGGSGIASTITGTSVTYAGGGGGGIFGGGTAGTGGTGGGGDGGNGSTASQDGAANTGGGGGGYIIGSGGDGGSGVIILRYPDDGRDLLVSSGLTISASGGGTTAGSGTRLAPSTTTGGDKVYIFVSGTGTVEW